MAKIKIFRSPKDLNNFEFSSLENILCACELVGRPDIYSLIDKVQEKYLVCACDNDDEIVGFMAVENEDYNLCINLLYVHYNDRNKGIASTLLKTATALAKKYNKDTIDLVVKYDNDNARKLYKDFRFIDEKFQAGNIIHMIKYTENIEYIIGGILFEMYDKSKNKIDSDDNNFKLEIQDKSRFYKYIKTENKDEFLEKVFKSDLFKKAREIKIRLQNGTLNHSSLKRLLYLINNDLTFEKEFKTFENEDKRILKMALLSVEANINFECQDEVKRELEDIQSVQK